MNLKQNNAYKKREIRKRKFLIVRVARRCEVKSGMHVFQEFIFILIRRATNLCLFTNQTLNSSNSAESQSIKFEGKFTGSKDYFYNVTSIFNRRFFYWTNLMNIIIILIQD